MKNYILVVITAICIIPISYVQAETLCYGFTKVEGERTNGVQIRAVYQSDTSIVLDTVSYQHPLLGNGYFHASKAGFLPAGKYDVHFEYGSYFKNKVIIYDPWIGPVNMGDVDLVKVEFESNDTLIMLRNFGMEVVLWRSTGVIRDLTIKDHGGLLSESEPGQIVFRDTLINEEYFQDEDVVAFSPIDSSISPTQVRVIFHLAFPKHNAVEPRGVRSGH